MFICKLLSINLGCFLVKLIVEAEADPHQRLHLRHRNAGMRRTIDQRERQQMLAGAAELRLGGKKQQIVRITAAQPKSRQRKAGRGA